MKHSGRISKDETQSPRSNKSQTGLTGKNSFSFLNGDRYEGEYLATKQPMTIVRNGEGTYFSKDGSIYWGTWKNDYLEDAKGITFPDQSRFTGTLENMILKGPGLYKFKERVEVKGYLLNNHFIGDVELIDPTGHYWRASNPQRQSQIYFYPVQTFWQSILNRNKNVEILGESEP